jgi:DNA-binding NarL/FixJ family response regulator
MTKVISSQPRAADAVRSTISSRRPRIVVADDSTVAREGIAAIIRELPYALCGLATDQQSTTKLLERHHPDLLLIEPFFGNRDGIFFLKELTGRFPETRILVVSKQPEEVYAERALRAGASGYWVKTGTRGQLIQALETVLAGELHVSPGIALVAVHRLIENPDVYRHASNLTDRELHVFGLIGAGFGTNRIAKELGISPRTVETYDEHIKIKLGYPDAEALRRGARDWFRLNRR